MEYKVPENPSENRIGSFTPLVAVSGLLIMLYLTANLMAVKVISIGPFALFDAGTITFPIAYMLSDVLAEIWGYRTAKKVIFLTFVCNILLVVFTSIGIILPYPDYMEEVQNAYATIYTYVPRIVIASLISFLAGDIMNAKILVAMRDSGCAVLLVSSDLNELLGLSDRLLVMYGGRFAACFSSLAGVDGQTLGRYMLGLDKQDEDEISRSAM